MVSYHPEISVLQNLLRAVSQQVGLLILVDNGGGRAAAEALVSESIQIDVIDLGHNLGLGYALNAGFASALDAGAQYVATFDQDSAPPPGLVDGLLSCHELLAARGERCAAVGPVFFDRRETRKTYFPFYFQQGRRIVAAIKGQWPQAMVETDALITSGMLVRADVWAQGVRYDDGLFIDYTDTEWCFRVRSHGYSLYGAMECEMGHALSDAVPTRVAGLSFFRYSPLRRYYYFRNTALFCKAPCVSWTWTVRLMAGLALRLCVNLVIDKNKWASLRMMLRGIVDALHGRTGKFSA